MKPLVCAAVALAAMSCALDTGGALDPSALDAKPDQEDLDDLAVDPDLPEVDAPDPAGDDPLPPDIPAEDGSDIPEIEDAEDMEMPPVPWLEGWNRRLKLVVDHDDVDQDLFDFPLMVYLSTASGMHGEDVSFVFSELLAHEDRLKIAVTTFDGVTQCMAEIDKWDPGRLAAWIWVKVPFVSSVADTILYLYYDADQMPNTAFVGDTGTPAAQSVWDNGFTGVWHMHGDPSAPAPQVPDSTASGFDGVSAGDMVSDDLVAGRIGSALEFDGSNDYVDVGNMDSNDWHAITVEAWIYRTGGSDRVVCKSTGTDVDDHIFCLLATSGMVRARITTDGGGGGSTQYDSETFIADRAWTYVAFAWDGADGSLLTWGDDRSRGSTTRDGDSIANSNQVVCIANVNTSDSRYFGGIIDEARISDAARPPAWLRATYQSGIDHMVDFGVEETR
jgi:hypothetical protein